MDAPIDEPKAAPASYRWQPMLVGVLAAAFFFQALFAGMRRSPAFDEPFHIASGLFYVQTGRIVRPPDHPPLLRELGGLSLYAAGVRLPASQSVAAVLHGDRRDLEYGIGNDIFTQYGPDKVLFWARLPFIVLGTLFVFVLYWMGRDLLGEAAGLCAAFLYAFDPVLLSNAGVMYTDTGVAFFSMLTMWALWAYVRNPGWLKVIWCGLALGAALASKYSAVALLPAVAMLLVAAAIWPVTPASEAEFTLARIQPLLRRYAFDFAAMCVAAYLVVWCSFLFSSNLLAYPEAMQLVNHNHNPNYLYYLAGHYARHFDAYYLVAWLLKEPLATVLLTIVGVATLVRSRSVMRLACLFLLVPAALFFTGYTLFSDDLGVRYIVPVLPFCFLAAGAGLAALLRSGHIGKQTAAAALCLWIIVEAAAIYPDHMSYFNEAACALDKPGKIGLDGGSFCGAAWLDDANVDSGEGLKELRVWLDRNAAGRPVHLGYFGSTPLYLYGLSTDAEQYTAVLQGTQPGLYAVSAQIVARAHPGPGSTGGEWLLAARPIAFVGHEYYIYEVP